MLRIKTHSIDGQKQKASANTVVVDSNEGRLRLRWKDPVGGKRRALYLGVPDGVVNRRIADYRAKEIESDIFKGTYDPSLKKYKSEAQVAHNVNV